MTHDWLKLRPARRAKGDRRARDGSDAVSPSTTPALVSRWCELTIQRQQLHALLKRKTPDQIVVLELPNGAYEIIGKDARLTADRCKWDAGVDYRPRWVNVRPDETTTELVLWLTKDEMTIAQAIMLAKGRLVHLGVVDTGAML